MVVRIGPEVVAEQVEAEVVGLVGGHEAPGEDQVAERLAHLDAIELQHAVVEPPSAERFDSVGALRLGDLIFMVRVDQVVPTAVDVDLLSEVP